MDRSTTAQSILSKIRYITLATVNADGSPWNSPVFFAIDDQLNIYWSSHPDSTHSKNIESTGKTFAIVFDSTSDAGEGVFIEAVAGVVEEIEEVTHALDILGKRRGKPFVNVEKFMAPGPQRIFKATPVHAWMNDADQDSDGDFIRDYRIPINL